MSRRQWCGISLPSVSVSPSVVAIVFLLSLGIFLRVFNFWIPDLWIDEYSTWWVIDGSWLQAIDRAVRIQSQSPFYYLLVKCSVELLGPNPFALRLPSILLGIIVLFLSYPLGMRLFRDRHTALLVLATFAVNQLLIWYSQEARPYALALCCTMLSFLTYVKLLEQESVFNRVSYVLATLGAYYAHYLFGFIIVIQLVHLHFVLKKPWWLFRKWQWTMLSLVLGCVVGSAQLMSLFHRRGMLDYISPQGWSASLLVALQLLDPMVFSMMAFMLLVLGVRGENSLDRSTQSNRSLLLLWFVLPFVCFGIIPPLFGVTLVAMRGIHSARYVLFALPAALCIVAWFMSFAKREAWRKWIPLAVLLGLYWTVYLKPALSFSSTFTGWPSEGFTRAAETLKASSAGDDFILFAPGYADGDVVAGPMLPDPVHLSALRWPLLAHLKTFKPEQFHLLPFRVDERTLPYLRRVLSEASEQKRVWVVGMGEAVPHVVSALSDSGFHIGGQAVYGAVYIFQLNR